MHPQAQRTIRRVFRKIAEGGDQVLFSTHSSLLVDVAYFDEIIRLEIGFEEAGGKKRMASSAWQLPMTRMIEDLNVYFSYLKGKVTPESIRDRYSHAYNPRRNEGFFASKVILVEGFNEEYSLPIYADALPNCAFDPLGISVVECGGKGAMDRLFRIFNELHIPCYILFDYDNGNSNKNIIEKSKGFLALAGDSQDTPQSLLNSLGSVRIATKPILLDLEAVFVFHTASMSNRHANLHPGGTASKNASKCAQFFPSRRQPC